MALSHGEHYELMNDLEDKLGKKTAVRLAEALPPFDWNELARQAEVNNKIDALDARLSAKIDALDGRLSGQINALDARLSGEVNALDGRLSGRIDHLSGEVNALKHQVAAQTEVTKAGFAEIGSRLDAMNQRLDAMDQRWTDRLDAMESKFEASSHEMLHRVYRTMFAVSGAVVAVVTAIVT